MIEMQYTDTFQFDKNFVTGTLTRRLGIYRCTFECWCNLDTEPHIAIYIPDKDDFDWCITDAFLRDVVCNGLTDISIKQFYCDDKYQYIPKEAKELLCSKENIVHGSTTLMKLLFGV